MQIKGIIFTALDTDHDNIESWNRWYDLEHLPPNIAMDEIAGGRRYVAPPELHDIRLPHGDLAQRGFEHGKGVNVTIYLTAVDPAEAIEAMTEFREVLEAAGRMEGAGRRTVRTGDAMDLHWVVGDPALNLDDRDIPYLGHTGIRVVLRHGGDGRAVAEWAVEVDGVHGVMSFTSRFFAGLEADIYLLSRSTAETTLATRIAAAYGEDAEIVLDAPFDAITPLDYSFAERIRTSSLPAELDVDEVMQSDP
ncbi:MAG: hypothetical protein F4003_13895 [Acidimicrobiaceae bacterium]|nr:hypothetical protein [Acidimicrobiaceae bacterium]MYC41784.1 hypothetical protein [Acidimicrobiaceae bacterium]